MAKGNGMRWGNVRMLAGAWGVVSGVTESLGSAYLPLGDGFEVLFVVAPVSTSWVVGSSFFGKVISARVGEVVV